MAVKQCSDIVRFWRHVSLSDTGCWIWTAATARGYAMFKVSPKMVKAYRFIWEQVNGPIPDGLLLHHVCENTKCVNPEHLELVTPKDHTSKSRNSLTFFNLGKTHCHRGHEFTPENTYTHRGKRQCRECQRLNWRKYDALHRKAG